MFIKFFKKIFTPKPQKDPHLAFYEDVPEPEIPILKCAKHIKFKKSCPICLQSKGYV
jgi:hypothetical protein